jgi:serine/threonine protein kinase/tetratricopeptide (TPR) repeat protein
MFAESHIFGEGRYRVIRPVGQGGVGTVYLAEQHPLGRKVALKVLRDEFSGDPMVRRRFTREARAAAGLIHPNIATVYDFGAEEDGTLYLSMEFIRGVSLATFMRDGLTPRELVAIIEPLLGALAYSHARGVIHRDLKPDNILIGDAPGTQSRPSAEQLEANPEIVKLVDFGIATTVRGLSWQDDDLGETGEGSVVGTPLYMSPEQARGGQVLSPATDLYSVGVLLFEGLTGRHPFAGLTDGETAMDIMIRHVTMPIPDLKAPAGVFVPEGLRKAVMKSLSKSPGDRFRSAAELRQAIRDAAHQLRGDVAVPAAMEYEDTKTDPWARAGGPPPVRLDVPLVARHKERGLLRDIVRRSVDDAQGQVILVDGDAGVGKTHLSTWLAHTMAEEGALRWVSGSFLQDGSGLRGIRGALESLFGVRQLPPAEAREILESSGGDVLVRLLLSPAGATTPSKATRESLFAVIVRAFEERSRDVPLLVLLEDVHWAGPEFGELLDYIAVESRYRPLRVSFLCTLRGAEVAANRPLNDQLRQLSRHQGESVHRISLSPLEDQDIRALVQRVLPASSALEDHIVHRSAGNALHILELLRYLHHEGLLTWNPTTHAFDVDASTARGVPPGLANLMVLRIAQLGELHATGGLLTDVLERCAVLGNRFLFETIAQMSDDLGLDAVDSAIDVLLHEGILRAGKEQGVDLIRFHQVTLREVLLAQLSGTRRLRQLHDAAGRATEHTHEGNLDVVALAIANHADAAGQTRRAHEFLVRAGVAARRARQLRDALDCYERAQALTSDEPRSLLLSRRIADLLVRLGDFPRASRLYRDVLEPPPSSKNPSISEQLARAHYGTGDIANARGDEEAARKHFLAGVEIARDNGLDKWVRAGRLELVDLAHQRGDDPEAEAEAEAILQESTRADDTWSEARALVALARILGGRGSRRGEDLAVRAQAIFSSLGATTQVAMVLRGRAHQARTHGDAIAAAQLFTEARAEFEALGDRREEARCLNGLGDVARQLGRLDVARSAYAKAAETFRSLGARLDLATALANLGLTELAKGSLDAAEQYLAEAATESAHLAHPYIALGIAANLTLVRARRGDWETVLIDAKTLLHDLDAFDLADPDYSHPLEEMAQLAAQAGHDELADQLSERALEMQASLNEDPKD